MAFLRRKGNTFYLVHNVRQGDRVKQLHLAKLGDRPRITDDVVRQVTRSHPFVDVNWERAARADQQSRRAVRPQIQSDSEARFHLCAISTFDLADLFPPLLDVTRAPGGGTGNHYAASSVALDRGSQT